MLDEISESFAQFAARMDRDVIFSLGLTGTAITVRRMLALSTMAAFDNLAFAMTNIAMMM